MTCKIQLMTIFVGRAANFSGSTSETHWFTRWCPLPFLLQLNYSFRILMASNMGAELILINHLFASKPQCAITFRNIICSILQRNGQARMAVAGVEYNSPCISTRSKAHCRRPTIFSIQNHPHGIILWETHWIANDHSPLDLLQLIIQHFFCQCNLALHLLLHSNCGLLQCNTLTPAHALATCADRTCVAMSSASSKTLSSTFECSGLHAAYSNSVMDRA